MSILAYRAAGAVKKKKRNNHLVITTTDNDSNGTRRDGRNSREARNPIPDVNYIFLTLVGIITLGDRSAPAPFRTPNHFSPRRIHEDFPVRFPLR